MKTVTFPRMHVSLYVSDIQQTVDFYTAFFGQAPEKVKADYAKFLLAEPALIISFVENKERVQENFGHLGIQVETTEELHERLAEMKDRKLSVKEEMGTSCCYATQDKFWVVDPDGIHWEIYYFHKDAEFNDPRYTEGDLEVCCVPGTDAKKRVELEQLQTACCEPGAGCC